MEKSRSWQAAAGGESYRRQTGGKQHADGTAVAGCGIGNLFFSFFFAFCFEEETEFEELKAQGNLKGP